MARPLRSQNLLLFTFDANSNGVFDSGDQIGIFGQAGDTVLIGKWNSPGQPLLAAAAPPPTSPLPPDLTTAQLAPLVTEATDIWMNKGLGFADVNPSLIPDDIMTETLPLGIRRLAKLE